MLVILHSRVSSEEHQLHHPPLPNLNTQSLPNFSHTLAQVFFCYQDVKSFSKVFLSCVIVRVRVGFRKTVVGDWCFDYLSVSDLQSQVKIPHHAADGISMEKLDLFPQYGLSFISRILPYHGKHFSKIFPKYLHPMYETVICKAQVVVDIGLEALVLS